MIPLMLRLDLLRSAPLLVELGTTKPDSETEMSALSATTAGTSMLSSALARRRYRNNVTSAHNVATT